MEVYILQIKQLCTKIYLITFCFYVYEHQNLIIDQPHHQNSSVHLWLVRFLFHQEESLMQLFCALIGFW